jgi:cell division protein FtsZ
VSDPRSHRASRAVIKCIGIGGAGGNAVSNMVEQVEGVHFIAINTDAQALERSGATRQIQIGPALTQGLGAGAQPDVGRRAAEESQQEIQQEIMGAHMLFIAAGMGGGTGTGAAPYVAQMAKAAGILTVAVVTRPFTFEGRPRARHAVNGIAELRKHVDTLVIIPNDKILQNVEKSTAFSEAFRRADEVLVQAVSGIARLITCTGMINVDFADVRTIMADGGTALMGLGMAEGDGRAGKATDDAIASPFLDDLDIRGARGVLLQITGGEDLQIGEITEIVEKVHDAVGEDSNIIFGTANDPAMNGKILVTLIATGFDNEVGLAQEAEARAEVRTVRTHPPLRPVSEPVATMATPGDSPSFPKAPPAVESDTPTGHPTPSFLGLAISTARNR